jgi:hypothetical protein
MSKTFLIRNGDVVMSSASGQPIEIADNAKLKQDLQENFTIAKRPSGFGAGLEELVGFAPDNELEFKVDIFEALEESIEAMKSLQQEFNFNARPNDELISSVGYLNVDLLAGSKTDYLIRIDVNTVDGDTITLGGVASPFGG